MQQISANKNTLINDNLTSHKLLINNLGSWLMQDLTKNKISLFHYVVNIWHIYIYIVYNII